MIPRPTLLLSAALLIAGAAAAGPPGATETAALDPNGELARITTAYGAIDAYSLEITFALYRDAVATEPFEIEEASIERRGKLLRSRLASLETLVGEEYLVVADHDSRMLMIDHRPAASAREAPILELDPAAFDAGALLGEDPEALLASAATLRVEEQGRRRTLSIDYARGEHRRIELVYDRGSYLLERATLFFRRPMVLAEGAEAAVPRIEIRYRQLDVRPAFDEETFSPGRFFSRGPGGGVEVAPRFSGYRLIQHLTLPIDLAREEPR